MIKYTLKNVNPSVILEHRWLYLNDQNFKIKNNLNKIHHATFVKEDKSNILIVTYGDGFVESLKAKNILNWQPKVSFHQLVKMMYESDLEKESKILKAR